MDPDDIRNEKVKVLKSCREVQLDDLVLGQYIADPNGTSEDSKMVRKVWIFLFISAKWGFLKRPLDSLNYVILC